MRRISTPLALTLAAAALALPAAAVAQATRTWVSGTGNDANTCARDAPCKTFAGAISKTAAGGEIDALDPGGYGGVTITKSITISGGGTTASVLVSGTNGIIVAASATDQVVLSGLQFDGVGSGLSGVRVQTGASTLIEHSDIFGFSQQGVDFESTTPNSRLVVTDSYIHGNAGAAVLANPQGVSGKVTLLDDHFDLNGCGVVAGTTCSATGGAPTGPVQLGMTNSSANDNTTAGVLAVGASSAMTIGADTVSGNGVGLQTANGGTITSLGRNDIFGNGTDGAPTTTHDPELGPTGLTGPAGAAGPQGAAGQRGATGPAGAVELVTCKTVTVTVKTKGKKHRVHRQKCTAKLVAGPIAFTTTGKPKKARAVLARAGRVYARGRARTTRHGTSVDFGGQRLKAGRYTLTLRRGKKVVGREDVYVT